MPDYENEAKDYIRELNPKTQKKAIVAIQDAINNDKRDWQWIATALKKKSANEWAKWGFGLFFDSRFQASVYQQMERDERCKSIDAESWLNGSSFDSVSEPSTNDRKPIREPKPGEPFYGLYAEGLDREQQATKSTSANDDGFPF